ncbi:RagB/SusD family nutrient uptake outer membrane protein [Flavivirga sp. 57AJ16]|uniref:RagB/SusD family nutrient uptake outer membrane protein n=1 Tax=Flavivirga sp. 57AJ16 TaxID=3025307 RepID=UPI002366F1E4|nr:RagB/SusD family nutrient uptake outer membrane protein [Flavivirga sp. 57AJ16]MDD7887820.1 RagB/SusD family nutrient uptake outer membrane protein [Flavivirga sp. 57AJ16]
MKKNILFIIGIMVVVLTSCNTDELLDITPYRQTIPSTVEEFRLLMDERSNVDGRFSKGRAPMYEIDFFMSDEVKVPDGQLANYISFSGETRYRNAITWETDFCNPLEDDSDWGVLYNQILVANTVLEAMDNPEIIGDDGLRNTLRSEAKVHRALAYFSLINLYSKQYNPTTASNDLGVPIRLTKEPSGSLERSSVQGVYTLILQDINEAIASGALPDAPQTFIRIRPSMASAYAVLAKVNLAMGDYDGALEAADNSLQLYDALYNYNDIFFLPDNFDNEEVLMIKERPARSPFSITLFASNDLIAAYEPSDLRLSHKFILDFFSNEYAFDRNRTKSTLSPTVPEMYLIRAECNARVGDLSLVNDDLNTIRENRISTTDYTPTIEFADRTSALTLVKEERFRELAGTGLRLFDLKRYNTFDEADIDVVKVIDGTTYTLEANSNRWIVPIARKLIQQNPEIEQSPR